MFARLAVAAALLVGAPLQAATAPRVYAVRWDRTTASAEGRALIDQVDARLREELKRRGATVVDGAIGPSGIVLKPTVERLHQGLKLKLIGLRGPEQRMVGAVSMQATGKNSDAVMKALVTRACLEADQLD
ncbi:MAG: hypothetical protein IAE78_03530 [Myxococcus sp.]|nr:hypothetical protein [Myxococcus sp.]